VQFAVLFLSCACSDSWLCGFALSVICDGLY
jgi:hypothetical protein